MKIFIKIIFIIFSLSLILISLPYLKYYSFKFTHPNWVEVNQIKILNYNVYCPSFHKKSENDQARSDIRYQYEYKGINYIQTKSNFIRYYRINFFEDCTELKKNNIQIFQEALKNGAIKNLVSAQNESRIFIVNSRPLIRINLITAIILKIQGIFLASLAVVFFGGVYALIKQAIN